MTKQIDEKRLYWIDVIRIVAMMLILCMHSPIPNVGTPGTVLSTLSFLTEPGIGLFFMISGALLLGNKMAQSDFLKHRFSKIVWPTLFWTAVYLTVSFVSTPHTGTCAIATILSIPFSAQGHGVLWFMYTLAGLYLLTPILSKWLAKATRRDVEFYLILWAISLLYPYLKLVLTINTSNTGILYYFTGYCGYFLLGYYMKKYVIPQGIGKTKVLWSIVAIIACVLVVFVTKKIYSDVNILELFWYLSMPGAIMSVAYFLLLSKIKVPNGCKTFVTKLSTLSFGVYLCHILVMRTFLWNIDFIHNSGAILNIPIVAVLTIILSWLLAYLISKLPYSKYIVGL